MFYKAGLILWFCAGRDQAKYRCNRLTAYRSSIRRGAGWVSEGQERSSRTHGGVRGALVDF